MTSRQKHTIDIHWLEPVRLRVEFTDQAAMVRDLQRQLKAGYRDQFSDEQMRRSVYIIRLTGSFVIGYPRGASPVLYIGRGDAPSRLAKHLAKWLHKAFQFGSDTRIEIRMLRPRRRNAANYFMNVEADLLDWFCERMGALPFFNSRREHQHAGLIDYGPSQERRRWQQIGTGSGKRPHWALTPMRTNPNYATYLKGCS